MAEQSWEDYLRAAMRARGFVTAADLARAAGVGESLISRWLRGSSIPDLPNLRKIAPVLGRPVLELAVVAGHLEPGEARMKDQPKAPAEPVRRGISTDGLNEDQERLLSEMADQLRRQNPKAR